MSLEIKDGSLLHREVPEKILKASKRITSTGLLAKTLYEKELNGDFIQHYRGVISIPRKYDYFNEWSKDLPSKAGFAYQNRFDFWAQTTSNTMVAVPFLYQGEMVFPVFREDTRVKVVVLGSDMVAIVPMQELIPLFPNSVTYAAGLDSNANKVFARIQQQVGTMDVLRTAELAKEPTGWNIKPIEEQETKTTINQEEDMTKTKTVTSNMLAANKNALKSVAYLNAGRASNKVIKEAVAPFIKMALKPTWIQKTVMRIFGIENPAKKLLKSDGADLVCAQLAQLIIEIRGVENEHVREVTQAGITYSMLELSQKIPFEEAMDKVVAQLEVGADGIVDKLAKKDK